MSKLWGIAFADSNVPVGEHLAAQTRAMCKYTDHRPQLWTGEGVGLGHYTIGAFNHAEQPYHDADDDSRSVYCGKIFDYGDLKRDLRAQGARIEEDDNAEDLQFVTQFMKRRGAAKLGALNGIYSCAVWEPRHRRLSLFTDRYGLRMVYYTHDKRRGVLAFASDLRGVVETDLLDHKINWDAWSTFFQLGHNIGDVTSFENVVVVPVGSALVFEDNQVRIEQYWSPSDIEIDYTMTRKELVEGSAHLFDQAMARRSVPVPYRRVAFLSGGLDSRRIVAALHAQGTEFTAVTKRGLLAVDQDGPFAGNVATTLGLAHRYVTADPEHFYRKYYHLGNELMDYEANMHQWIQALVDGLEDDEKLNYDGIMGDWMWEYGERWGAFMVGYAPGGNVREETITMLGLPLEDKARRLVGEPIARPFLAKAFRRNIRPEAARAAVIEQLVKYGANDNQLVNFFMMNRARRGVAISAHKLIQQRAESLFPYLDNDLFDLLMRYPPEKKAGGFLREEAMALSFPECAGLPRTMRVESKVDRRDKAVMAIKAMKKRHYYSNLRQHALKNSWLFHKPAMIPRMAKDLVRMWLHHDAVAVAFTASNLVFYEWMEKYFRHGHPSFHADVN